MLSHSLCYLILTSPVDRHSEHPSLKMSRQSQRQVELHRRRPKTQTQDFCSVSLMPLKTLLLCNLEFGIGPREEELSRVVTL